MQKPVLVIKLGTAVISDKHGLVSRTVVKKVAAPVLCGFINFQKEVSESIDFATLLV